jgi:tetratricopeptide (TPR) repeat protein
MESGSAPVESYVFLAQIILQAYIDAAGDVPLSAGEVPEILEARSLLEAGLERDGRNFVALLDLARTYLLSGQTEAGVQALEKARVLRPLDLEVLHLGACLLARGGKPDEAWSVIARSLDPRNPDVAREAGDCVVEGTVIVAHERLSAGDREGAQEVLDRAMKSIDDLRLVGQLEPLQRTVSQGGTIVFEERQENPAAKRYDAILDLAQSGEYEEALRQLEAFVKDCTGADLCRAALENAKKLRVLVETNKQVARFNEAVDLANRGKRKPAIELLVELEQEVTDPKLLQSIRDTLRGLGHRPRK